MAVTPNDSFLARLNEAFREVRRPPDKDLFGGSILHSPGEERPELWPQEWRALNGTAIQALNWNSLSSDGFRFYLPALLLVGDGNIGCNIRAQHVLTDGLLDIHRTLRVRYQGTSGSWVQMRSRYLSQLTREQAGLAVEFLMRCRGGVFIQDDQRRRIEEALANFWLDHAGLVRDAFWASHGRLPQPSRTEGDQVRRLPPAPNAAALEAAIRSAFTASYPGDDNIRGSDLGCEPYEVAALYRGRNDWRPLDPGFLDQAGLNFLSAAAFRFYLPAFLLADLHGALMTETPSFHLAHGLDNVGKVNRVNPHIYGERTWFDHVSERFAAFTTAEASVILGYLSWIAHRRGDFDGTIAEAIENYWLSKSGVAAG
jgi:hypothetical protein